MVGWFLEMQLLHISAQWSYAWGRNVYCSIQIIQILCDTEDLSEEAIC